MESCVQICEKLLRQLDPEPQSIAVHSWFNTAGNLRAAFGLATVLPAWKDLQPFSIRVANWRACEGLQEGSLAISNAGIWKNDKLAISFRQAESTSLAYRPRCALPLEGAVRIRRFLERRSDYELFSLVGGRPRGVFAREADGRFRHLRDSVARGDGDAMVRDAAALAGCGTGLTPSSDDLICGYLWALSSCDGKNLPIKEMAEAAAERTNDISGMFLANAGKGLFSADILALSDCLLRNAGETEVGEALRKVADFGCTSGRDFLTGGYFGIIDAQRTGRSTNWSR